MKVGTISLSQIAANGGVLNARFYLDRCSNCGGDKDNPKHHQNGKCGQYKRVFVESGTDFVDANKR